ncbi:pyridoxamine 5'-phosphate oxidase family protein [Nocardia cyriacigeorgica]|uniref:Pyridoxamine 5'-phosphate oxidase family protein n=1 Tax=Nocardia cyriacigeorgica TaxID=135487 RepID=A0A6P1D6G5_9NOCA|nr:pyridoxamine 5'-phosphate oxidase family protein [Nocardia cyriacigeorgica]NEW37497.1 pyridoxamine 5'-phosphate oxidase family protein [Nocardia cyriacigeorgica]NEW44974.1 pyridoxamine 5'-phosphate oxidase family protein [Nocardia cyriacigeorgica]NEW49115.1 pyridoxamine 5'-phosphate oxidase family protein [Nocardia cyriacigeorgica]NEW56683.1 pyridoxamine 5'-phosphate oxidase family protein [Nocardia cyriacigeorgica]
MSADADTTAQITEQEVRDKLSGILATTSIDLATSKDGVNWCSSAFFAHLDDDPFRLTLILESGGRTLEALRANPNVGIKVVSGGFVDPFAQGMGTIEVRGAADREETFQALVQKEPMIEPFFATPVEALIVHVDWWRITHIGGGWLPGRRLDRVTTA